MFFTSILDTGDCFIILVFQFIAKENFYILAKELFHLQALSMPIFVMHFVGFSFHSCSIMTVDSRDVFVNGVREDGVGEGFPLFVYNYGVGIGEA
jgi:hypothetical protein